MLDGEIREGTNNPYENATSVKKVQLEKITILMEKVAGIELEEKNMEPKKYNFYVFRWSLIL